MFKIPGNRISGDFPFTFLRWQGAGALYDFDPVYLVIVSVAAQACSILFYVLCIKVRKA